MELFYLLAKRSWRTLVIATLTGLICGLAAAGLIALINNSLNAATPADNSALLFIALALLVVLTRVGADVSLITLGQSAVNDLRLHLAHKLIDTRYRTLQQLGKHRLLAILTDDTQTVSQAIESVPILLVNGGIILACLGYLGWLSPTLLVATILLMLIGASAFHWPQRKALQSLSRAREQKDTLFQHYRSLTDGSKELQLNQQRRRHFFERVLEPSSLNYKRDFIRGLGIYALVLNWGNGLFYLLIGLVLFAVPAIMTVNTTLLTGYILTILYMITPLSELMNALPILGRASIAVDKINHLEQQLQQHEKQHEKPHESRPVVSSNADHKVVTLSCTGVSHTYYREREDGQFTLGPFNLTLNSGELTFITGGNGGGKTTLALLLTGLYSPESGDISINNSVSCNRDNLVFRQHFSAVFTDFCLFEHLIDCQHPQRLKQAQDYLAELQLDHKVQINDGKLSTLELSTGQRKRLALLAAYLEDRPCYLFDEWAADQDPLFKEFFYTKILTDLKRLNKLVIAITHDDTYFHLADRLIKVDHGQVIELNASSLQTRQSTLTPVL